MDASTKSATYRTQFATPTHSVVQRQNIVKHSCETAQQQQQQ